MPPKILIVDDISANLVALRHILKKVDADIIAAGSGNEALAATLDHEFCLILLDAHMPEMDGYETAEILSSNENTRHIPIIFITAAYKDELHRLKGYSAGAIDYIQKPIEESILLSKVKLFLQLYLQKTELRELAESLEEKVERRTAALQLEIEQRELSESNLRENQNTLAQTQRMARIGGCSYNGQGEIKWSDQLLDIFGLTTESVPSIMELQQIVDPKDIDRILEDFRKAENSNITEYETEFDFSLPGGEKRTANSIASIKRSASGKIILIEGAIQDITERKEAESIIKHMAHHDELTGLANRNLFHIKISEAFALAKRSNTTVAVLLLDLDHFKDVNDTLGHMVGDKLLQKVAFRLNQCCRETDTIARLGGDEFAIISVQLKSSADAVPLAMRCIRNLSREYAIDGNSIHTGTSIGISSYPIDSEDATQIIKNADVALYQAKDRGRGTYRLYNEKMDREIHQRKAIEHDIRKGIERSQFELYYQPQLDINTRKLTGLEALIRWRHPEKDLVSPDFFIPIAETSGLIIELGEWVLREACRQLKYWRDQKLNIPYVSVNVSVLQISNGHFVENLRLILNETKLLPENLELEITESVVMEDLRLMIEVLSSLHELGVSVAIDDFGTGFSSLSYLKNLPLTKLKIDKSFVKNIEEDAGDAVITKTIIDLGHNLGLSIIAEGVETEAQATILKSQSCDSAQGYLYAKPMSASAVPPWVEDYLSD